MSHQPPEGQPPVPPPGWPTEPAQPQPDLRPPAWREGARQAQPQRWQPQQPPAGWPPPAQGWPPQPPPSGGGGPSLLRAMAYTFVGLLVATVIAAGVMRGLLGDDRDERASTEQPAGGSGNKDTTTPVEQREREKGSKRIVTGTREQRGTMTLVFPREVGRWEPLPFVIKGVSRPAVQQAGSAWISIFLAHRPCPARRPDPADKGVHRGPTFQVYADGSFQGAGNLVLREQNETQLNVCGYFGDQATQPADPTPELVVSSSVDLLDRPREPLPPGFGYLRPGTYRASGKAVRGGGPDAEVEFEVVDTGIPGEVRTLLEAKVSGLEPKTCGAEGARLAESKSVYFNQLSVTDTLNAVAVTKGVGITGGTADGQKARGQVFIDYGQCTATIRFVAERR